ncbi:cadherin domain-containing protein [Candidatus Poribacteria bacterium]|nr:cadherin domain-containing protein [Candidatus Poribacteria bacterium]
MESFNTRKKYATVSIVIISILLIYTFGFSEIVSVSERTPEVGDAIVNAISEIDTIEDVSESHLTTITNLSLRNAGITELKSGDFSELTALTKLNLYGNSISSLPDGIFKDLNLLTTLRLGGNTVDPIIISVTLEKVAEGQFRVLVPVGAPFDIAPELSITNGSLSNNSTSVSISVGKTESHTFQVTRTPNSLDAVSVNIVNLPDLPRNHYGYQLSKSSELPIDIIDKIEVVEEATNNFDTTNLPAIPDTDNIIPDTDNSDTNNISTNSPPKFLDGEYVIRNVIENAPLQSSIGSPISASDDNDDELTYTIQRNDGDHFSIDNNTGQLKINSSLNYNTKSVHIITVAVSDSILSDLITVYINVKNIPDLNSLKTLLPVSERTPKIRDVIVELVPGVDIAEDITEEHLSTITNLELRSLGIADIRTGDFSGLTGLETLNLYNNQLYSLPNKIFEGLTSLTSLRLGRNLADPLAIVISIFPVGINQYQAEAHTGAPFNILVPITVTNGYLADGNSGIVIEKGNIRSAPFTVTPSMDTINSPLVEIGTLPNIPVNHFGYILTKSSLCTRTKQVSDAITEAIPDVDNCINITELDLTTITSLDLSGMSITSLKPDDFSGLISLKSLSLPNNQLTNLPEGIFSGLVSLEELNLSSNAVSPISIPVKLLKIRETKFFAQIPHSAPFDIKLPLQLKNETDVIDTELTILKGSKESSPTLLGIKGPVTIEIQSLSIIPTNHSGYQLTKDDIPLVLTGIPNTAPLFSEGENTVRKVKENSKGGEKIGNPIIADDKENDSLIYTLSGTDVTSFTIDPTTGQLLSNTTFDYGTKSTYSLIVIVSDGDLTDSIEVVINISKVLDLTETENRAPIFTEGSGAIRTVTEKIQLGEVVGEPISATDPDNDTLTYSLSGTDAESFTVDSLTGQLKTNTTLDYEVKNSYTVTVSVTDDKDGNATIPVIINVTESGTDADDFDIISTSGQLKTKNELNYEDKNSYSFTITATDDGTGNLTGTVAVTINLNNVNDAPTFVEGESIALIVNENTTSNENIQSPVAATDEDGDTLSYTLSGTDSSSFGIDSNSGQIKTNASLDHETKDTYIVDITVTDDGEGTLSSTIEVLIYIIDVNEAPVFADASKTVSVDENTATNQNIGSPITASDEDDGDTITYSLSGDDVDDFDIVGTSGQLKTKSPLNYEDQDSYSVTITATDDGTGSLTDTIEVTININDVNEAPAFDSNTIELTVDENSATDTNIGSPVTATDVDEDTLTYTLGGTDSSSFNITDTSGQLKTKDALDHESKDEYSVTITATDNGIGSLSDTITVTISINDVNEPPTFIDGTSTSRSIEENTPAGQNIGTAVGATDVDDGDTLEYTLGGTDASSFSIVDTSGQLQTSSTLDYEAKNSYTVTITVSDGSLTDNITVTINVSDVNEILITPVSDRTQEVQDTIVAAISGIDSADDVTVTHLAGITSLDISNQSISSLSVGDFDGLTALTSLLLFDNELTTLPSGIFDKLTALTTLNLEDNDITDVSELAGLTSITDLDLEGNPISDYTPLRTLRTANSSIDIDIDIDNNPPVFTEGASTTRSVAENTESGQNIGTPVPATDTDASDTLTYSLGGTDASSFSIDESSGQIQTSSALDYEAKTSYSVIVAVSDGNNGLDRISVTINVTDVVESPNSAPTFTDGTSTTRSVAENTVSGQNIGTPVAATDSDTDDTLEYTLGGTDAASFSIVDTTGQLQTNAALDFESKNSYTVTVTVSDGSLMATITVTINITDVSEGPNNAPVFDDGETTTLSVNEEAPSGSDVDDPVTATDTDDDMLTYSISGTDATSFTIDSTNGQLKTAIELDYDTETSYSLTVSVSDGNGGTDSITVTINVIDGPLTSKPISNRTGRVRRQLLKNIKELTGDNSLVFEDITDYYMNLITEFDLSNKNLNSPKLKINDFEGLTSITSIDLSNTMLETIEPTIFSGLTTLQTITLTDNGSFETIPADLFDGLTSLQTIELDHNGLTSVKST